MSQADKSIKNVVAIGGSAGALEAFESLIKSIPSDSQAAYVILQHMDPAQKSLLPELLANMTKIPVVVATDNLELKRRHIYVLEAGTSLTVRGQKFICRKVEDTEQRKRPIDIFFNSLASNFGSQCVGIVVSGNGTDGTNGLRSIREAGGRTIVQLPSEAKYEGMPQSAISSGVVDRVISTSKMGDLLSAYISATPSEVSETEHEEELNKVCEILLAKTGHDFSSYKKSTVARRVERRIQANILPTLTTYIEYLEKDPAEPLALLKDLLISVTHFFRDAEAFESLNELVIPRVFESVRKGEPVRVWVPACATGEEAYTIAILLREYQRVTGKKSPIQIFATDIDRAALDFARVGFYPKTISDNVHPEYLKRYFNETENGYQAKLDLREVCLFSEHSLIKNPPFSRIDLISCRNLFIYWEPNLQMKILPVFHYALNTDGYLFLGPAENVSGTADLFKVIDKKSRIFQRNEVTSREHLFFPIASMTPRVETHHSTGTKVQASTERDINKTIITSLLEDFAPPAFVINEHGEILFYSGKTGKYLEPPTGAPSNVIFDVIRKAIRPELHALVHKAMKTKSEVNHPTLTFENEGIIQKIKLTVKPMSEMNEGSILYLVALQEIMSAKSHEEALREGLTLSTTDLIVQQLEGELRDTREHLQSTIEEVKSSNEEFLSMNEELQSANEELQTSKEELQSTNEELETVNSELSKKVEELDLSNSDLQNFFNSAQVPILFLDRKFRIQRFTPAATRIFRLIPSDIGRGILDITADLEGSDLTSEFSKVLETLQPIEKEVASKDLKYRYLMRVSPYKTINNVIDGVITSFSDVTELKKAQESKSTLAAIVDGTTDAIVARDLAGNVTAWNKGAEDLFHYNHNEAIGKPITLIIPKDKREEFTRFEKVVLQGGSIDGHDTERIRKDGTRISVTKTMSPIRDEAGTMIGLSVIYRDNSERKRAEELLARSHDQMEDVLESMSDAFFALDKNWKFIRVNSNYEKMTRTKFEYCEGRNIWEVFPKAKLGQFWIKYHVAMDDRKDVHFEEYYPPLDGWFDVSAYPTKDGGIAVFFRDVSIQKRIQKEADEANERFKSLVDSSPNLCWMADLDGKFYWFNNRWYTYTGLSIEESSGDGWHKIIDPKVLPEVIRRWEHSVKTFTPFEMTYPILGEDGVYRWFLVRAIPMKDKDGKIYCWMSSNTNVDEQRQSRDALKAAVNSRDEFLSIASHELKTPLTTLLIQVQMRKRNLLKQDEYLFDRSKLLKMIESDEKQIHRLTRLIDDMLDIARISSGRLSVNPEDVNLCALVREVADRLSDQLQASGCDLIINTQDEVLGSWDRFRIEQVITNLFMNAAKYGPGKPIVATVSSQNGLALFTVKDQGMGIAKENHERIFMQFERAVTHTEVSGLGLGLYIVKQILEAHHGTIEVESELGHGALFTVKLPLSSH